MRSAQRSEQRVTVRSERLQQQRTIRVRRRTEYIQYGTSYIVYSRAEPAYCTVLLYLYCTDYRVRCVMRVRYLYVRGRRPGRNLQVSNTVLTGIYITQVIATYSVQPDAHTDK